ncbi:MAG: 5-formyltetrahydrofolate cyclo-ligase [Candidatus Aenigmatarchaeota archaeon]
MKRAIRKEMKEERDGLSHTEMEALSLKVKDHLFSTPEFRKARTVMFYASFGSEVQTERMIREALAMGKRVALPVVSEGGGSHSIVPYGIKDFPGDACPGAYGIMEPSAKRCRVVPAEEIELVIVPGTAFDCDGGRIGYGKGYYDRFLAKVPKAVVIGLAYDFQVLGAGCRIPREEHDARVCLVVTDERIIRARIRPPRKA